MIFFILYCSIVYSQDTKVESFSSEIKNSNNHLNTVKVDSNNKFKSLSLKRSGLTEELKNANEMFSFIEKTFPKHYNAKFGLQFIELDFNVSYATNADAEYREIHKKFITGNNRLIKHEIVQKGNLSGEVTLTSDEILWCQRSDQRKNKFKL